MAEAKRFERKISLLNIFITPSGCRPCIIFPHRYMDFEESVFNMIPRRTGRGCLNQQQKKSGKNLLILKMVSGATA